MGALTRTYCDYAAGNDYKGATFTDGAYTAATKTLVKASAFAASQVNHWLYLESNDGGSIVAGYYKIATVTDANTVILATDAGGGVDDDAAKCTQYDGTTSLPWRSVQGALDLITRDATNGDQVNVKAGTAQVNQAALTLARYGTPAEGIPLVLRGYTSAANDGGVGEIDCNGFTMFATTGQIIYLAELKIHNFGDNSGVNVDAPVFRCEIYKGVSSPSGKTLLVAPVLVGCYIHDAGTTGIGWSPVAAGHIALVTYFYNCPIGISTVANTPAIECIFRDCSAPIGGGGDYNIAWKCNFYSSTASTGTAIALGSVSAARTRHIILNNIIEGYSGVGGKAISNVGDIGILGYNAFYNNTTNESLADVIMDLGNDASLASSPFTNAAGGDFSLAASVVGAIDGAFPGTWYGPASTTDHADIGAVQNGAGAGGGTVNLLRGKLG